MTAIYRALRTSVLVVMSVVLTAAFAPAQPNTNTIVASDAATIRRWDPRVDAMLRSGDLEPSPPATASRGLQR